MDVHVSLVGRRDLSGEIYRQLRSAIATGRLGPGDPLPPSRELARRLTVSRTTVMVAYDRLAGEGLVTSRVGAGTFVSTHVPGAAGAIAPSRPSLRPRGIWDDIPLPTAFERPADFDFRTGLPASARFPFQMWRRLMAREMRGSAVVGGVYGDPAGHAGLRHAIARHVGVSRGLTVTAADVTVTNGTQQALDLVARVLLAPGDRVAVEDPGYEPPRRLFDSLGLAVSGVPVDQHGLVVDALPRDARLVYVTPSHQYPLGSSMALPRRTALLAWAEQHDAAVIEDDYDSEFRFGDRPLEPLHTLDTTGRVIYVGSFSKTLLPTLRLGFVVTPTPLHNAIRAAKFVTDWHTSLPTQAALAQFIDQGEFARHIRRMRAVYHERHDLIMRTLTHQLSPYLTPISSATGLHISATANRSSADLSAVAERAMTAGVAVAPLSWFQIDRPAQPGLVLGYGAIESTRIEEGLRRLRRAFDAGG